VPESNCVTDLMGYSSVLQRIASDVVVMTTTETDTQTDRQTEREEQNDEVEYKKI